MSFLAKNIVSFEPRIFGLDLSDLSVKVFQIEKEGKFDRVRAYASLDIPAGNIDDGQIINEEEVVAAIQVVIKAAGPKKINTNKVICSLPESKAFLRIISIPKMSEEEAQEAIKWEMEANIPVPLSEVYFDWQFLPEENSDKQQVLTAAISKTMVDDWMKVLAKAGLEVYGLEIESIASARSLIQKNILDEETNLIVDLGARRTSFIITKGSVPYFTSGIPFSSEGMNDAISKSLNLGLEEAEITKIANGIENADASNPIFSSLSPLLENLLAEIIKTMDFYREMSKQSSEISRIILCGGGSNMKGLAEYLSQRINKEVVAGDPWANLSMGNKLPPLDKDAAARYATAIGLALKGSNYGN